ncbi:MAG: glycosyltransferase family 2 protein [Candidatus Euphemobacter frigidus]|nr:glycosyltransferase family 2 protein [Candidatus Euphemobacter frigidus]MDP8276373.1 glycosyltransferase family 2 protein [Candidatus Euphemobacter frigidus]
MELVSVIVLTCNGREHLEECLNALKAQTYPRREVILVINGSEDGSAEFVRERFGDFARIIELPENIGYTGGNNAGLRDARGEYIALLNDDTRVDPSWLEAMVEALRDRPGYGLAACKILSYYRPEIIDNVGHIFYRDGTFRGRGRLEVDRGQYDREEEVLSPSGCAFLIRKEALDEVGFFDEEFFIYGDDAELSLRIRLAGWKVIYVPSAVVYHKYSATTGAYSPFKAFLVERNRIWLTIKYFPPGALMLAPAYAAFRLLLQVYGVLAGKGAAGEYARKYSAFSLLKILIKAHLAALAGIPRMWRKRLMIKRRKKVSNREFYSWFKRFALSARELALKE